MQNAEKNTKKIQELESAKEKLNLLIDKIKENPEISDEELAKLSGGTASAGDSASTFFDTNNTVC